MTTTRQVRHRNRSKTVHDSKTKWFYLFSGVLTNLTSLFREFFLKVETHNSLGSQQRSGTLRYDKTKKSNISEPEIFRNLKRILHYSSNQVNNSMFCLRLCSIGRLGWVLNIPTGKAIWLCFLIMTNEILNLIYFIDT